MHVASLRNQLTNVENRRKLAEDPENATTELPARMKKLNFEWRQVI